MARPPLFRFDGPETLAHVRLLERRLAILFGATWAVLSLALGAVASTVKVRGEQRSLDDELAVTAMATYGLAYYDANEEFHDDFLAAERGYLPAATEIWIVAPGRTPGVPLAPREPVCRLEAHFLAEAPAVLRDETVDFETLRDEAGRLCRVRRMRTYSDADRTPVAAIFVAAPTERTDARVREFRADLFGALSALCGVGILLAMALARHAVRPLVRMMGEREQFLRAAAHELKTPLAKLRVVTEADAQMDAGTAQKLIAIISDADRAAHLLLRSAEFATLESRERTRFRLDLTVEAALEEGIPLESAETVVLGDPDWIRIAIDNMLHNAKVHGGGATLVRVDQRGVFVFDRGAGFTSEELSAPVAPFRRGGRSSGTGLGLALAAQIAASHGGQLERSNREGGGAAVGLTLPTST